MELLKCVSAFWLPDLLLLGLGSAILVLLEIIRVAGMFICGIQLALIVLFINISLLIETGTLSDAGGCNRLSAVRITLLFKCSLREIGELSVFCVFFIDFSVFITSELVVDIKSVFVISSLTLGGTVDTLRSLL